MDLSVAIDESPARRSTADQAARNSQWVRQKQQQHGSGGGGKDRQRHGHHATSTTTNGHADHLASAAATSADGVAVPPVPSTCVDHPTPAAPLEVASAATPSSTATIHRVPPSIAVTTPIARKDVTFHAEMVTPGLTSRPPPAFPTSTTTPAAPARQPPSILKTRSSHGMNGTTTELTTPASASASAAPGPHAPIKHALSAPLLLPASVDVTAINEGGASTSAPTPADARSPSSPSADGAVPPCSSSSSCSSSVCSSDPLAAASESIIAQYQPVYPSWRLILTQLQQPTLWDRLFTHCTGRDLMCKIVQHSCGLLRCLLQVWERLFKRLAQYATFRRIFFHARDTKSLLPTTAQRPSLFSAAAASSPSSSAALTSISTSDPAAPPTGASTSVDLSSTVGDSLDSDVSAVDPAESWVPPSSETSSLSSLSHRLDYISHTMYRSRQVLRLGRWLYDIPDVRESARELWYGHSAEEKSMEEQEAEEEWEEHERLPVVRAYARRASFDASGLAKLLTNSGALTPGSAMANGSGAGGGGGGAFTPGSSAYSSSVGSLTPLFLNTPGGSAASAVGGASVLLRGDQPAAGRGTFLFPLAKSAAATAKVPAQQQQQQPSSNSSHTPGALVVSSSSGVDTKKKLRSFSSAPELTDAAAGGSISHDGTMATRTTEGEDDAAAEGDEAEEEDDDGMTVLEWTVGVIDLTNSLMGLIIDASDDVEFIASLGVLPSRVGDVAGQVSSYLWLVSGAIDVAMCAYKLHAYRREMREAIAEQLELLREQEAERMQRRLEEEGDEAAATASSPIDVVATENGVTLATVPPPSSSSSTSRSALLSSARQASASLSVCVTAASGPYSMYSSTTAAATSSSSTADDAAAAAKLLLVARPLPSTSHQQQQLQLTLCTAECDVDCFHIEYLRFYRYLGELGLSVCGVLIDEDIQGHPLLVAVLEASGLFSGIATFIKRGATHARSKKLSAINDAFRIRDDAGVPTEHRQDTDDTDLLYSPP